MATDTFQSFWYGSELSSLERLCLRSFVNRGKNFELYTYDDSLSVPDGVVLRDASEVYPENEVFAYQSGPGKGSVSVFSNLFRYKLLYDKGGWWVDTDVFYTGNCIPDDSEYFVLQNDSKVGIAVLGIPKGSKISAECINRIHSMGKDVVSSSWGKSGPKLFTQVLKEEDRIQEARQKSHAYPVSW